jgi:hypothetical protein
MLPENRPYCVYLHRKLCGEVFYVGIGSTLKRPFDRVRRNTFWKKLVKKHTDFEVQVILKKITKKYACELEVSLIEYFGRRDLNKGTLVNLTNGGESTYGRVMEQWQIDKMSEDRMGRNLGEENPNYGNSWSIEQKENMSQLQKQRFKDGLWNTNFEALRKGIDKKLASWIENPSLKEKMARRVSKRKSKYNYLKIDKDTLEVLEEFDTFMELKDKYPKVGKTVINSVCNGWKKSYRGFIWRYRCKKSGEIIIPDKKN